MREKGGAGAGWDTIGELEDGSGDSGFKRPWTIGILGAKLLSTLTNGGTSVSTHYFPGIGGAFADLMQYW